jgi:hypothetical protein
MKRFSILVMAILVVGCTPSPPPNLFLVTPEQLQQRQLESRLYDGVKEGDLLSACANLLQDLGFQLENSESKLGVLTATKQRGATQTGEVIASIFVAILTGAAMPISKDQVIRVSLVVRPVYDSNGNASSDRHYVRVTFQRVVRRTNNSVYTETLSDPQLYQSFYDKLSKSVFIEAEKI